MQLFKQLKNISKHKLLLCSELNVQLLYLRGEKKKLMCDAEMEKLLRGESRRGR